MTFILWQTSITKLIHYQSSLACYCSIWQSNMADSNKLDYVYEMLWYICLLLSSSSKSNKLISSWKALGGCINMFLNISLFHFSSPESQACEEKPVEGGHRITLYNVQGAQKTVNNEVFSFNFKYYYYLAILNYKKLCCYCFSNEYLMPA